MMCVRNAIYVYRDVKALLFPAQFADAMRSRDFDAAAGRAADALADAEAETEVWSPGENPHGSAAVFGEPTDSIFRSGGQIKQYGPRPRIATAHAAPKSSVPVSTTGAGTEPTSDSLQHLRDAQWPNGARYTCVCSHQAQQHPHTDGGAFWRPCVVCDCTRFAHATPAKPVNHYPELPGAWGGDCGYCDTGTPHPGGPKVSAVDDKGRPPGFYTSLEQEYATEHYSFPANPTQGQTFTASDGGIWVRGATYWEATNYPPGGDPYFLVKQAERQMSADLKETLAWPKSFCALCGVRYVHEEGHTCSPSAAPLAGGDSPAEAPPEASAGQPTPFAAGFRAAINVLEARAKADSGLAEYLRPENPEQIRECADWGMDLARYMRRIEPKY